MANKTDFVAEMQGLYGPFTLTGQFQDDYDTPEVDGRKLDVSVGGDRLVWETAGYGPTLQLPAHPAGHEALAAFLRDERVKPVLEARQIGFEQSQAVEAAAITYTAGSQAGTFGTDCAGKATCGPLVRGKPANTCGGGAKAIQAIRVTRASPSTEDLIAQCCPPITSTGVTKRPWFGLKVCPTIGTLTSNERENRRTRVMALMRRIYSDVREEFTPDVYWSRGHAPVGILDDLPAEVLFALRAMRDGRTSP